MTPTLLTSSYRGHLRHYGVAVQISVGRPKFPLPYWIEHQIDALKPFGLFGKDLPWPEFERRYRARLDRVGVPALVHHFQRIAAQHPGRPIVLLCFEWAGEPCHRRVFAQWWLEQTGQAVPEVHLQPAQNDHIVPSGHLPGDQLSMDPEAR